MYNLFNPSTCPSKYWAQSSPSSPEAFAPPGAQVHPEAEAHLEGGSHLGGLVHQPEATEDKVQVGPVPLPENELVTNPINIVEGSLMKSFQGMVGVLQPED